MDEIPTGHPFVEGVLFGAQADEAVEGVIVPDTVAEDTHFPLAGMELPRRQLQKRRLAGAVGTEQPGDARRNPERNVVDADDVTVPLRYGTEVDNRRHRNRSR